MKLIKTEKQFTNPFIEGALDIYADIENGNECGENNAWIELDCSALFLGLSRQRIEAYFTGSKTSEEVKACLSSAKIFARGQTREKNFISWRGFGLLVANYASYVKNAMSILDTWQHYSWVADIEKEIVGQAETFLKLAKECKERGDKRGFYSFMERYESEKEWEAKLKAEKERADKAEEINNEREQRLVKDVINEIQRMPEFKDIKITARVNSLLNGKSKFQSKLKRAWSGSDSGSVYQQTGAADIFEPIWTTCQKHPDGGFYELLYVKGKREEAKAYIVKLLRKDVDAELEHKRSQTLLLF